MAIQLAGAEMTALEVEFGTIPSGPPVPFYRFCFWGEGKFPYSNRRQNNGYPDSNLSTGGPRRGATPALFCVVLHGVSRFKWSPLPLPSRYPFIYRGSLGNWRRRVPNSSFLVCQFARGKPNKIPGPSKFPSKLVIAPNLLGEIPFLWVV